MNRDEILPRLNELMRDIFDEPDLNVTDETRADDVADWDSANHVRLVVALEEEFGIRFETEEIATPQNVGELVDLIARKA